MRKDLLPVVHNLNGFRIVFSTKDDGNMLRTNETREAVHANRLGFLERNMIPFDSLALIRTSHSPNIDIVTRNSSGFSRQTYLRKPVIDTDFDFYYFGSDGLLTFDKNLYVGLMSGDCVPVIVWDNDTGLHGILHVGLLGALNKMVMGLPTVLKDLGVSIENINVYLGPSITQKNYNISRSGLWTAIIDQVNRHDLGLTPFISKQESGDFLDVQGFIAMQLQDAGIPSDLIQGYERCIADDESLFISHSTLKKTGVRGNFLSIIGPATAM